MLNFVHLKLFFFTLHILNFFYPKINKPSIHNNIINISSFQNGLNNLFSPTGFSLKSKVIEGNHKGKNMFFNFWALLLKMCIFAVVAFFFLPSGYTMKSTFQWQYIFIRFMFLMKHFSS